MNNADKMANFVKLRGFETMTDWDDIKEGETYHMPPLIFNKRMDFLVLEKKPNSIRIKKHDTGYSQIVFRTDITTKFIVKKWDLNGTA